VEDVTSGQHIKIAHTMLLQQCWGLPLLARRHLLVIVVALTWVETRAGIPGRLWLLELDADDLVRWVSFVSVVVDEVIGNVLGDLLGLGGVLVAIDQTELLGVLVS
jgi:hypothetical protein